MTNRPTESACEALARLLAEWVPEENLISDPLRLFAYGTDASFYRLNPALVVRLDNVGQVQKLLSLANELKVAVTFRAAGTSLSGQAITDSVLVLLGRDWQGIDISDDARHIWLQPGVIGADANRALARHRRKIGPDPASINSCKVGGIAANNASGMCCGTAQNSYHTLRNIKLVLADGSYLDTSDSDSRAAFQVSHATLLEEIQSLARDVSSNARLAERISHKYRLKNTTGYGLNALIDYDDPIDILSHLMIGSEGTLGFIAGIEYQTIALPAHKATGLFVLESMQQACEMVQAVDADDVSAIEIMDSRALKSVAADLARLGIEHIGEDCTGLLIEVGADNSSALTSRLTQITGALMQGQEKVPAHVAFTEDPAIAETLWNIRKGMFPAVGAVRERGSTVIIEDIAVPLPVLPRAVADLHQLFARYGYHEAIIFGHAKAGNLHFVFTQKFETRAQIDNYHAFMQAVCELVAVQYQGSLKAEHGTGRNMAPFVELEWGTDLYRVMRRIKSSLDPKGILNPGVIINDDPLSHIHHLKTMAAVDDQIDACIECGFCEAVCPSKDFTLTPRQRIALMRERARREHTADVGLAAFDDDAVQFHAIDSCAATGLCAQRCPVGIDTGVFVKSLRAEQASHNRLAGKVASWTAEHFDDASAIARFALKGARFSRNILGEGATRGLSRLGNIVSGGSIPLWHKDWPEPANPSAHSHQSSEGYSQQVLYIPSCSNRIFGHQPGNPDQRALSDVFYSLCQKAGIRVIQPENVESLCCGMPWSSKGQSAQAQQKRSQWWQAALAQPASLAIVTDASSCQRHLLDGAEQPVMDSIEFAVRYLLPALSISPLDKPVMLHKTCSSQLVDGGRYLRTLAEACARDVVEPQGIHCCGFAGDKGFSLPALNASALAGLSAQVPPDCHGGYSNNRTCEIGLSHHSGLTYQSLLYLLDEVSQSKQQVAVQ